MRWPKGDDGQPAGADACELEWHAAQLHQALADGEDVLLLDVREPHEYAAGHLPDTLHIPLGNLGASVHRIQAQGGVTVVVCICRSGHRSLTAATVLRQHGLHAVSLKGGVLGWNGAMVR